MLRFTYKALERIPFSSLFGHNYVLERVFSASPSRVALSVETSNMKKNYTYGQLQRDVIKLADAIVKRKNAVYLAEHAGLRKNVSASSSASLPLTEALSTWMQPPRDPRVRSVFAQGENIALSCDALADTGSYVTAILASPGYEFVVSLLASWSLNLLVTVMSISQHYEGELTYILEHSGAVMVLGDAVQLKAKFPPGYNSILIRSPADMVRQTKKKGSEVGCETYQVNTVIEVSRSLLEDLPLHVEDGASGFGSEMLKPEEVKGVDDDCSASTVDGRSGRKPLRTATDVVERLEEMKAEEAEVALAGNIREVEKEFDRLRKLRQRVDEEEKDAEGRGEGGPAPLQFNTERAEKDLNPCFLKWFLDRASRPTPQDDSLMIYTSGTTAKPKGVVHSHASIRNQVTCLQDAWAWRQTDSILHVLPLHHVHGLVNVLLCSLSSQARCVLSRFDPRVTPQRIQQGDITLFMAVPTIYTKMIAAIHQHFSPIEKKSFRTACETCVRLMVSGSAALPVPTLEQFRELSGHTLLERYGMTEIGMGLSQPLYPVNNRIPGTVGSALPTVETWVPLTKEEEQNETRDASSSDSKSETSQSPSKGEYDALGPLAIASDSLFDRYWRNPSATKKELRVHPLTQKKYFDTGDTVGVRLLPPHPAEAVNWKGERSPDRVNIKGKDPNNSSSVAVYTILGRSSVDIIKRGGYKISALEIEATLLSRKDLFYEVVVVGCPNKVYGEEIVAIVALQPAASAVRNIRFTEDAGKKKASMLLETAGLTEEMKKVAEPLLAPYKRPNRYILVPEVFRNPTGKVNKKELKKHLGLS